MKKYLLLPILFILTAAIVSAANYTVEVTSIRDNIKIDETAQFLVIITNELKTIKNIRIYSPEVEWSIPPQTIKAYPETETSIKLIITPTKYIGPGMYGIKINFKEEGTDELVERIVFVNVKPPGEAVGGYVPSVDMDVRMGEEIDPREPVIITIVLKNQNVLNLTDLKIRIRSDLEAFNIEQEVQLSPLEEKGIELTYELDPLQEPGSYKLSFEVLKGKKVIESAAPKTIEIISFTPDFKEEIEKTSTFFKTVTAITYTSQSNVKDSQLIKIPTGLLKRLFTLTDPESRLVKEAGKRYFVIDLELDPGQAKTIYITTNYRILFYVAIVVIIGLIIYFMFKSPVRIRKGVSDVKMKEGGISEVKVMLEITNASKRPIKNITIVDYVPNISEISKEFVEGTLKPTRVLKHEKKGTILKWELAEMAAGEDRLVSYDIISKLSILGNFRLPRAKVVFKRKGKEIHVYSNSLGVSA